jgi:phage-related protein
LIKKAKKAKKAKHPRKLLQNKKLQVKPSATTQTFAEKVAAHAKKLSDAAKQNYLSLMKKIHEFKGHAKQVAQRNTDQAKKVWENAKKFFEDKIKGLKASTQRKLTDIEWNSKE